MVSKKDRVPAMAAGKCTFCLPKYSPVAWVTRPRTCITLKTAYHVDTRRREDGVDVKEAIEIACAQLYLTEHSDTVLMNMCSFYHPTGNGLLYFFFKEEEGTAT